MPSPRDLDPKFKTEKTDNPPTEPIDLGETENKRSEEDETTNIVYRQRVTNPDGTVGEKVHGPMPVADWPAYEKENNL